MYVNWLGNKNFVECKLRESSNIKIEAKCQCFSNYWN